MAKKKPVGTVVELSNDYEDLDRNFRIIMHVRQMFGAPGTQPGSKWWRRGVKVWRLVEHQHPSGSWIVRNELHWVLRLYFRNPADAVYVQLKLE